MIEVVHNPLVAVIEIVTFTLGLTAIAFIAFILSLEQQREREPLQLP